MATRSSNFYTAAADWTGAQHEAAASALGFASKLLMSAVCTEVDGDIGRYDRGHNAALVFFASMLAKDAAHHAHQAEREDERMAAILAAQCSYGQGAPLTDEEIAAADAAHCRACSSIPCRCCGVRRERE